MSASRDDADPREAREVESFRGIQQKALLLYSNAGRHGNQKLDHAVIEKHRPHFDAVRHAHGVEIAQQARLQMRVNIHERKAFAKIFVLDQLRPVRQMIRRFRVMAIAGERRETRDITVQEKHLHRQLRSHKRIVGTDQVRQLTPTKREGMLVEQRRTG